MGRLLSGAAPNDCEQLQLGHLALVPPTHPRHLRAVMHVQQRIEELYAERFGSPPERIQRITGDGSARLYWRLQAPDRDSVVGAFGPEYEENDAFLSFSRAFRDLGLPVPKIYAQDLASRIWLLEDLGDSTLFDLILEARP